MQEDRSIAVEDHARPVPHSRDGPLHKFSPAQFGRLRTVLRQAGLEQPLIKLGRSLPWDEMAAVYHRALGADKGRPSIDARTVIGAMIIKHRLKLTDESTVEMIGETRSNNGSAD